VDRMSLRALRGARLDCLNALRALEHAGINDLSVQTGYDRGTVSDAMRALLMHGLVRRAGARGDFWPTHSAGAATAGSDDAPAGAGAAAGHGAEHPIDGVKHPIAARSSSSYLNTLLNRIERNKTTTTTPADGAKHPIEGVKHPIDEAKHPMAEQPVDNSVDNSRIGPIVDLLVVRASCPRPRAVAAVVQALRGGWHPAYAELQAFYWTAYVWSDRAHSVQNPGAFVAARISQCMPAPASASMLLGWEDDSRLQLLKDELEELERAAVRAARALERGDDWDPDDGEDGEDGEDAEAGESGEDEEEQDGHA
jgi:hypothetical protein